MRSSDKHPVFFDALSSEDDSRPYGSLLLSAYFLAVLCLLPTVWHVHRYGCANSTSAIGSLKSIVSAQSLYAKRNLGGNGQLAPSLAVLGSVDLIDSVLSSGEKAGYRFDLKPDGSGGYDVTAVPVRPFFHGDTSYHVDETATIRYDLCDRVVDRNSPLLSGPTPPHVTAHFAAKRNWERARRFGSALVYALPLSLFFFLVLLPVTGVILPFVREQLLDRLPTRDLKSAVPAVAASLKLEPGPDGRWDGEHRGRTVLLVYRPGRLVVKARTTAPVPPIAFERRSGGTDRSRFGLVPLSEEQPGEAEELLQNRECIDQLCQAGRPIIVRGGFVALDGTPPLSEDLVRIWVETVVFLAEELEQLQGKPAAGAD